MREHDRSRRRGAVGIVLALTVAMTFTALVSASPVDAGNLAARGTFSDDDGNIHEGNIEAIARAGITKGCNPPANDRFCPDRNVTRGEMAAFLSRALRLPSTNRDFFVDDHDTPFEGDINRIAAAGITKGCNPPANNRYCPNAPVTRGQMAAFLVRAFGWNLGQGWDLFDDDDGKIFEADIDRLGTAGVTRGCNAAGDRYCPNERVKRDQMASFLARALARPSDGHKHYVIHRDTEINDRLVLRRGDTVELRNGACLCFGPGGSADWQGTRTSTWSNDGNTQNLERDLVISGKGHVRFMAGSRTSTIRFVEINVQPPQETGKYPLHFHHAGNGVRGTLVEGVVVKNSTNRAFVPHASHGITFRDTIAKNVAAAGYWWDLPPDRDIRSTVNNSNDIVFDHILADGVGDGGDTVHGRGLVGISLGAGTNNVIRNSVAMNVSGRTNSAGILWPAVNVTQPTVWDVDDITAHHNAAIGLRTWQNNNKPHVIDGARTWANGVDLFHGAYDNNYLYRDVDFDTVEVHARGWTIQGGRASDVVANRNALPATNPLIPTRFIDVDVETFTIRNADNNGDEPTAFVFTNTGLTWANVFPEDVVAKTRVTIDGETRLFYP
jgi:hypothetical protein